MTIRMLSTAIALALLPAFASAAPLALLPAEAGDLVPQALIASKAATRADIERTPVTFAWALAPNAALEKSAPFVAQSREYWKRVSAAELASGITLHTGAPGALLRLSPAAADAKRGLDASAVRLWRDGVELRGDAAFDQEHVVARPQLLHLPAGEAGREAVEGGGVAVGHRRVAHARQDRILPPLQPGLVAEHPCAGAVEALADRPDKGRHAEQAGGGDHRELLKYALVAAAQPGTDSERVGEGHRHQPEIGDEDAAPRDGEHRQQRAEHRQVRERVQQVKEERLRSLTGLVELRAEGDHPVDDEQRDGHDVAVGESG